MLPYDWMLLYTTDRRDNVMSDDVVLYLVVGVLCYVQASKYEFTRLVRLLYIYREEEYLPIQYAPYVCTK